MLEGNHKRITASELRAYLSSLEKEKEREKVREIHDYKMQCNARMAKVRKREISKIEKTIDKDYETRFKVKDEILDLLDECEEIPSNIEELQITEYMLYRVDIRKAEKIINKAQKKYEKRYNDILEEVEDRIVEFPVLEDIGVIDYSEYSTRGEALAKSKEQYKLEYTEEERNRLIERDLEIIEKVKQFNSIPIPHEILKNSDKDIQSKMQKFNTIRQKRIRLLSTMKDDYERLLEPRELLAMVDEAMTNLEESKEILTKSEYNSVRSLLIRRKRKINRSTNDIRSIIDAKEKKTGIVNFNVQQARYLRMEYLRNTIAEATALIKENPIEQPEEQLEKLKISYEREKQFASVIEKLDDGRSGNADAEVRVYEEQINALQYRLMNSKRIVAEEQEKIENAKKELLVLWKIEINSAVDKKRENLSLPIPKGTKENEGNTKANKTAFLKLKKISKGKHAAIKL